MRQGTTFREDIAWAAGLFEGEGCITICGKSSTYGGGGQLALTMTDEDIVQRFRDVVGVGQIYPTDRGRHKRQYRWVASNFENVQAVIAMLWPWLGPRRSNRAVEVLAYVRARTHNKNKSHCKRGHEFTPANLPIHICLRTGRVPLGGNARRARRTDIDALRPSVSCS